MLCMEIYPLIYLSLETREMIVGQPFIFYDVLFDGEYVQKVLHVLYFQCH